MDIFTQLWTIITTYPWIGSAIFVSPNVGAVITQRFKLRWKAVKGVKPHWLVLDTLNFSVTGLTAYALASQSKWLLVPQPLIIAALVAVGHTIIMKCIFAGLGFISPKLVENLENGVDIGDDRTLMAQTKTMILGKKENSNGS